MSNNQGDTNEKGSLKKTVEQNRRWKITAQYHDTQHYFQTHSSEPTHICTTENQNEEKRFNQEFGKSIWRFNSKIRLLYTT